MNVAIQRSLSAYKIDILFNDQLVCRHSDYDQKQLTLSWSSFLDYTEIQFICIHFGPKILIFLT